MICRQDLQCKFQYPWYSYNSTVECRICSMYYELLSFKAQLEALLWGILKSSRIKGFSLFLSICVTVLAKSFIKTQLVQKRDVINRKTFQCKKKIKA